jgi:undecaprenyl-diphosphatase
MVQHLWELDQSLFRTIHVGWHREWLDPVFWVLSSTGLGWVQGIAIFLLLPWKRAWQDAPAGMLRLAKMPLKIRRSDWKQYAGPLLLAWAFASIFNTGILKNAIERERPSNLEWASPQETFFHNAFPSGHTSTSFAIATMLMFLTLGTGRAAVGGWALLWAALVGISRIYRGVHWPTDVLGGALVGIGSGCLAAILLRIASRETSEI